MDVYDVFKKLTKGLNIRYSDPFVPELKSKPKLVTIKKEDESQNDSKSNPKTLPAKKDENNSFAFFHGSSSESKKRKRKSSESHDDTERKKRLLAEEEVNHYRNVHGINVVGRRVPNPARSFEDFQVEEDIISNLRKCGYSEPTEIQKQAVPVMLQGRQLLACAPTGSGKTAAFLVPIIQSLKGPKKEGFRALILCPTRELAKQTQRECMRLSEGRGFRVHIISKVNKALEQYGENSSKKYDILITTPNRLCFLLKQNLPAKFLASIEWLVVDEADKLFEEGVRSFRDQLNEILLSCTNSERKIAMFSATYTPAVAKWCVHNMKGLVRISVGQRNAAVNTVDQELRFVSEDGKLFEFRKIVKSGVMTPVLVFVQSKERAQQLFRELIYDDILVDVIHSDRTQAQRDNTVRAFREGKVWFLICTELMARGIDFKGVNLVINYDFPPSAISYVHRIGRAGRAGRTGKAITFFTTEDTANLRSIANVLKESGCEIPSYILTMKKAPKKAKKQLQKSAPKRDEIITKPIYERMKGGKRRKCIALDKMQKSKESTSKKGVKPKKLNGKKSLKVSNSTPNEGKMKMKKKASIGKKKVKGKGKTTGKSSKK